MIESISVAREKLKTLAGARGSKGFFLTVTLSTSRLDDWRQFAPTFLNSEFNRITKERDTPKDEKRALQDDLQRVLDVLSYEVPPETQGLAVFADGGGGMFEQMELPLRLVNRLVIEPSPYVRPVVHALSLLEPFVVVRVSNDDSSIYLVNEWRVSQEGDFTGPHLKSTDRQTGELAVKEYYAAARVDQLAELHHKDVANALAKLVESSGVRRVALCAQHDIAMGFRRMLPATLAAKVVAEIPWDAAATTSQMLVSAREAVEAAKHKEMEALAARINEGLGAKGHGVAGFDEVLAALTNHQLKTMLVDRNYRVPGWRCKDCDWVAPTHAEHCASCVGGVVPVADAVGELVRLAVLGNAFVEVAEDIPLLDDLGGVAGILRYV